MNVKLGVERQRPHESPELGGWVFACGEAEAVAGSVITLAGPMQQSHNSHAQQD